MNRGVVIFLAAGLVLALPEHGSGQTADSTGQARTAEEPNSWGMNIMASDGGFGLGMFYRREFTPDLSWFTTISISESKDDREVEQFDPYTGLSFVPGKLNRFLVLPLVAGIEYRLFREDIMPTFRPYVNGGVGPTMVYEMPFVQLSYPAPGVVMANQIDFFKAIGSGHAHYTVGGYIGFGANFGSERGSVFGVNFRYYIIYLLKGSLPSTYDLYTGETVGTKREFGGVAITLTIGTTF
jgi:hypothetical protein